MSEHTEGPWRVTDWHYGCPELGRTVVAEIDSDPKLQIRSDAPSGYGDADARLMAAAPELLEACNALIECESHRQKASDERVLDPEAKSHGLSPDRIRYLVAVKKAKTAIAKAEEHDAHV